MTEIVIKTGYRVPTIALNMHDFKGVREAQLAGCTLIYCGRGSPWGNPYVEGRNGDRATVIAKHRDRVLGQPEYIARIRKELTGKGLLCHCKPLACHCDLYVEICDADDGQRYAKGLPEFYPD